MDERFAKISRRLLFKYPLALSAFAMLSDRRSFAENLLARAGNSAAQESSLPASSPAEQGWFMPSEQARHKRCWMAWPTSDEFWDGKAMAPLAGIRRDIARLAQTIARFEPVTMIVRPGQEEVAKSSCGSSVSLQPMSLDDTWFRDSGPVFLVNRKGGIGASTFNFNAWGKKQSYLNDGKVAEALVAHLNVPLFRAPLVTEGGALEPDGDGTLLVVTPSIFNENRNPGKSLDQLAAELRGWLGVQKVVWIPIDHPDRWTDGHVDGKARFVKPGEVLADLRHPEIGSFLERARDAKGRKIKVTEVEPPTKVRTSMPDFCKCYLNFYIANSAVIMPQFGDAKADERARGIVANAYPERQIVPLDLDALASGGGLIHCVTQQEPLPIA
jgi:agmatine deiminase